MHSGYAVSQSLSPSNLAPVSHLRDKVCVGKCREWVAHSFNEQRWVVGLHASMNSYPTDRRMDGQTWKIIYLLLLVWLGFATASPPCPGLSPPHPRCSSWNKGADRRTEREIDRRMSSLWVAFLSGLDRPIGCGMCSDWPTTRHTASVQWVCVSWLLHHMHTHGMGWDGMMPKAEGKSEALFLYTKLK